MTDTTSQTASVAALTFIVLFTLVLILAYVVPAIIIWWQLYVKANKPGWASIVPVYNYMVMAEIGEKPFWMGLTAGILSLIGGSFSHSFFGVIIGIGSLVLSLILVIGMIQKFDCGIGFWVFVVLLPIVGVFMVKDAKYVGTPTVGPVTGAPASPTPPQA